MSGAAFAYAQVRLQAQHGQRAREDVWQPLSPIGEFRPFLEQARATPLRAWISNVSPISPLHEMEQRLRGEYRRRVATVASWLPKSLQSAVLWTRTLVDLPMVDYLLRREPLIGWMLDDELLRPLAAAEPDARAAALAQSVYAPLARGDESLRERWVNEWQRRLPTQSKRSRQQLLRLVRTVRVHLASMQPAEGEELMPARAAWALRRMLEQRFVYHFRWGFLEASGVFAFLMLEALEFERLRGELVRRRVFVGEAG